MTLSCVVGYHVPSVNYAAYFAMIVGSCSSLPRHMQMWRCACRSIAGILGALAVHQSPIFANSNIVTERVGLRLSSHVNSLNRSDSPEAAGTTEHSTPHESQQALSDVQSQKHCWPKALQQNVHFAVLNGSDGSRSDLSSVSAAMTAADVVFLGEYHDDPVAHALQLELLKRAAVQLGYPVQPARPGTNIEQVPPRNQHTQQQQQQQQQQLEQQCLKQQQWQRPLTLSMEMFERDVQTVLDEYLSGTISLQDLMRDSRPWPNYLRDYAPMVQFCKQQGLKVVAANAPRQYVSLVGRSSRDALLQLSATARGFLAPLPYGQPSQRYISKVQNSMQQAAQEMHRLKQQEQQHDAGDNKQQQQQQQPGLHEDREQHMGADVTVQQSCNSSSSNDSCQGDSSNSNNVPGVGQSPPGIRRGHTAEKVIGEDKAAAAYSTGTCPYIGFNVSSNFLDAQVLWDATMAHSIAEQLSSAAHGGTRPPAADASPDKLSKELNSAAAVPTSVSATVQPLVIHVCGKFHCEEGLGIPEHLAQHASGTRMLCVVFVPSKSMVLTAEEFQQSGLQGLADYVVLTDGQLPRSFDTVHPV